MNVKDRLKYFITSQKLTVSAFESTLSVSNGYVNSISKSIGVDKFELLIEKYPNLNITWLITGKGEMLLSDSVNVAPIGKSEPCQSCIDKDKVIATLEKYNSLLEDTVMSQKNTIAAQERASQNENYPTKQTA